MSCENPLKRAQHHTHARGAVVAMLSITENMPSLIFKKMYLFSFESLIFKKMLTHFILAAWALCCGTRASLVVMMGWVQ